MAVGDILDMLDQSFAASQQRIELDFATEHAQREYIAAFGRAEVNSVEQVSLEGSDEYETDTHALVPALPQECQYFERVN